MNQNNQLAELINNAFEKFAEKRVCDDLSQSKTYRELSIESEKITDFLRKKHIQTKHRIGICAPKSIASYAALLGVIRSEAAYVPIDPLSPISRIETIINDSQPIGIIGDSSLLRQLLGNYPNASIEDIPGNDLSYLTLYFKGEIDNIPESLVCILYTSGSTGKPKGVMITHQNAFSYIQWASTINEFSEKDVFTSIAPFHFALSLFDLYVPLIYGACIVLLNEKTIRNPMMLTDIIEEKRVTVWYSTPSVLIMMMQYGKMSRNNHSSIRLICYAGEVFPSESLRQLRDLWPEISIYNQFGSTETNVCTWRIIPKLLPEDFDHKIIGKGCSHLQCKLLNNDRIHELEIGTEGELVISGPAVTPGYFGNAANLSADKFIVIDEVNWYRMGDWAVFNDQLEFKLMGRIDRMVKKRGNRIELDEIEKVISKYNLVDRSGVVAIQDEDQLIIKVVFECLNGGKDFEMEDLQNFVKHQLPDYMIPDIWMKVDKLSLTSTHKVDYQKLKTMT